MLGLEFAASPYAWHSLGSCLAVTPEAYAAVRGFPKRAGGEEMTIFEAAMRYKVEGRPLIVIAGKEYGTGSSRDWAAKGTVLLGVRAVKAGTERQTVLRVGRSMLEAAFE